MKILHSRKGFTLIELLVVIGILAVLAAIAIPSVAGLIDRANVSADNTNADEMTNAMERFVTEYEMYCHDVQSGTLDIDNMSASQSRVYNVLGTADWDEIRKIENGGKDSVSINKNSKYPENKYTTMKIIENYEKTSSSTFEPKQSDKHFFYSPKTGTVVTDSVAAWYKSLNSQMLNGTDGQGGNLSYMTEWIDLTSELEIIYCSNMYATVIDEESTKFSFFFPEAKYDTTTKTLWLMHNGELKEIKSAKMLRRSTENIPKGEELTLDNCPSGNITTFNLQKDITFTQHEIEHGCFSFHATYYSPSEELRNQVLVKRMVFETTDGMLLYSQPLYTVWNDL